jgi:hypothetical protein
MLKVPLAVLNLYVHTKIRVATFTTNNSVTDGTQSVAATIQHLPDYVVKSITSARHKVDVSGE